MASYRSSIPRDEARTHCREEVSAMSTRLILVLGTVTMFLVAACSGSASTAAPAASAPAASEPAASAGGESGAPAAGAACTPSTEAGTVQVKIANFAFDPAEITAKVGDVVTFTNNDSAGHTATSDTDAACTTDTIANGATGSLMFSAAGTYPFHCKIHPNMKGTITVS
jgi:plastocyanin